MGQVFTPSAQQIIDPRKGVPDTQMGLWMQTMTLGLGALQVQGPGPLSSLSEPPDTRVGIAVVTDSDTVVWGDPIAGSGADTVLAWWNGTDWSVVGK